MLQIVDVHSIVEKTYQRMNLKSKASYLDKGDAAQDCLCMYVPVVDFDNRNIVITSMVPVWTNFKVGWHLCLIYDCPFFYSASLTWSWS